MLLAMEVGNTNIVLAVYHGSGDEAELLGDWRIRTDRDRTTDEHGMLVKDLLRHRGLELSQIHHVAISSVVPPMTESLNALSERYFGVEPFFVRGDDNLGIVIHPQPAGDVGADRICNAVGAFHKYGGPAIVADYGTATNFDAVAANGDYLGGAIMPGIGISMDALFRQASRLFRVEFKAPEHAIGKSTVQAMQSGAVFGYAGQTDAMVDRFREELGGSARVIATGGYAELIQSASRTIEVVDQLVTLDGLRILFERRTAKLD